MHKTLLALVCLLTPAVSSAQLPVSFGVLGGPTFNTDGGRTGYHVGGVIGIQVPLFPVAFRVDGAMNRFTATGGVAKIYDVTANVLYSVFPTPLVTPYLIGGVGFYSSRFHPKTGPVPLGESDMGANFGAGVKLSALVIHGYIDARYHKVFSNPGTSFIPVTIGIMF